MSNLVLEIRLSHRPAAQSYFELLFEATHFEFPLVRQKLDLCVEKYGADCEINIEKLCLDKVHVARCCDVKTLADLITLLDTLENFSNGDFIRLNRAIGAFDYSNVEVGKLADSIYKIAPIAYQVKDNFKENGDIRDKEKYTYVEVGRGILIGIPKNLKL